MHQWSVKTPKGEEDVQAMDVSTTQAGDLLLKRQDGLMLRAYAKGAWEQVQLKKPLDSGYGPK